MVVPRIESGRECVIAWPADERSTSGATIRTSPYSVATSASTRIPGLYTPSSLETRMRMRRSVQRVGLKLEFKNDEVHVRVALFHNEDAGDGSSLDEITALLERHGHHLVHVI